MRPSLSVMFFGAEPVEHEEDGYALVRAASIAADQLGYEAVWFPERHFDAFGGLFPAPAVLAGHIAAITKRCHLRAGSVVAPLHDTIRLAEEWSVVDNLAGAGRVGLSIGSGWNTNDFVLAPQRYEDRARHAQAAIGDLRTLWSAQAVQRTNGSGKSASIRIHPRPISSSLPLWLTASGNPQTFRAAGRLGVNVLTHMLGQDLERLSDKISTYRDARGEAGHDPDGGRVTVMLHTLVTAEDQEAWEAARPPLRAYLRSALDLELRAAAGGGTVSGGRAISSVALSPVLIDELLEERCRRFFDEASLLGSTKKCLSVLDQMGQAGVNEIACLVDFGPPKDDVISGLRRLAAACTESSRRGGIMVEGEEPCGA